LSPAVTALVERCLKKRPEDRYRGGADLLRDLRTVVRSRDSAETRDLSAILRWPEGGTSQGPEIRYCRTTDGASIAYAVHGSGPVLVRVLGWFTHLEMEWEWPALRLIWERLGRTHTVVRYDGRGIGLSSSWTGDFTEETRQLDLDAVVDAIGSEKAALYGISEGGWTAAQYACARPERVSHLIVYGSYSRGARLRPGYDPDEDEAVLTLIRKGWGTDTPKYRQIFTTAFFGEDADGGLIAHFNRLQRAATDGDTAARYQQSLHLRGDAHDVLAQIRTPTLVIHCRDDRIIPFDEGRRIASIIPEAQLLPLPTGTHYFPVDDDITHRIAEAIDRFTR
jgi:pimeloyl-ACP methyl ester carboxylesterase